MFSVIIPAFNESQRIIPTLESIKVFKSTSPLDLEIIIVCDGCSDDTEEIVTNFIENNADFKIISYPTNRGKGFAVRQGILASTGDFVGFMDADGSTNITELTQFATEFEKDSSLSCIIASRRSTGSVLTPAQPWYRQGMGLTLSVITRFVLKMPYADTQCGFKFFRGELARRIFSEMSIDGFSFDLEVLYYLHSQGYKILELGVHWHNEEGSTVSPLKDGLKMLRTVFRIKTNSLKRIN